MNNFNKLPIAIIGAGPIGLAAAAHLSQKGQPFIIFEAGNQIAANIRSWEHVAMFSPWKYNIDSASSEILSRYDWTKPDRNNIPTGRELIEQYLIPLSETDEIKPHIRLNSKVISISRKRINKIKNYGRETAPFVLHVQSEGYSVVAAYARAVIDASGTWQNPTPMGSAGLPVSGELEYKDHIHYGIPDILGTHSDRYLTKNVAVIGSGHSAINALLELADLKKQSPTMKLFWILRKSNVSDAYGGLDNDELPGRGRVGQRVKELVEDRQVEVLTPFFVDAISKAENRIIITGESNKGVEQVVVDEIIVATGLKPDLEMLRELRISLDTIVESPVNLAPLIDPNIHSCGSVEPHGEAELSHPEKDFYIVGMKSYGRAPTFLLATGFEQVRSVVAALTGDWKAAKEVQLELPETGVCGVPKAIDPNSLTQEIPVSSCCDSKIPSSCDENSADEPKAIRQEQRTKH
ncbi:MAG: NAD(P)-binding domain-containing protein [Reichenbachiella sp.]|uniref:NAD(P)-binding domain-containing protein n=2 Tax=Reichenbachiella sp. TaxID=2184521 RepID=UPI003266BFAF